MLIYLLIILPALVFSKRVSLGGLFFEDDPRAQAFRLAVQAVNQMRETSEDLPKVFFVPEAEPVPNDIFEVSQYVCSLVSNGVVAIIGPSDKAASNHVQSMCDTMDVPNILTRWDPDQDQMKTINFYPDSETLSMVFLHLVNELKWKGFTLLYDHTDGLIRMHHLLKKWDPKGCTVTLRHLGPGPDYRDVMKRVKQSGETNIIIDCSIEILGDVLNHALQVGILSDRHKIIISSLDLQTLDLEPYQHSGVNITGVRLLDPENAESLATFSDYLYQMELESLAKMQVEWALVYDAVQLLARAFKQFKEAVKGNVRPLECDGLDSWEHGATLANFIRAGEMRGLTGLIKFHTNGFRSDFKLDIVRLGTEGLTTIGAWNSSIGIEWRPEPLISSQNGEEDLANQTFNVIIALVDPFDMLTESATMKIGNDRYEGFAIDIIHELSKLLHFNYTFIEQTDKNYGKFDTTTQKWTGMLGKIISKEADLAITDLAITSDREKIVDFTMPFMNLGISILYIKPTKAAPSLFSFLSPLSSEVWLYLLGAFVFTSSLLWLIGRMCPAEWNNPYPCIEEPEELENQFTISNAFWFTIGAIMQQGSEIAPIGISTRMMGITWSFFCLIMVSSYTANLAAFLVVETIVKPFKSAEDLANLNGQIKYGAKRGGATYRFFEGSNYSTYATMYKYMAEHADEVMTKDNDEGVRRVLNGDYAFLMESPSIEYVTQRQCNLSQVGDLLDAKGYGIAMRKHFPYRNKLNSAILQMQETGALSILKKKWWEEKRGGGKCKDDGGSGAPSALGLDNVGGVFFVLVVGITLSIPFALGELMREIGCKAYKEHISFKEELVEELKFVVKCKGTVKPVRKRKSSSQSTGESGGGAETPPYGFVPTVITTYEGDQA